MPAAVERVAGAAALGEEHGAPVVRIVLGDARWPATRSRPKEAPRRQGWRRSEGGGPWAAQIIRNNASGECPAAASQPPALAASLLALGGCGDDKVVPARTARSCGSRSTSTASSRRTSWPGRGGSRSSCTTPAASPTTSSIQIPPKDSSDKPVEVRAAASTSMQPGDDRRADQGDAHARHVPPRLHDRQPRRPRPVRQARRSRARRCDGDGGRAAARLPRHDRAVRDRRRRSSRRPGPTGRPA